jgi:predicted membrane protein DUF2207
MAIHRMVWPLLALLAALLPTTAQAEERILFYGSDIQVRPDASLEVTETIRVRAEGVAINHGIYREFPTRYSAGVGREMRVGFEVEEVKRDGASEPWSTEGMHNGVMHNGVRIRIGDKDRTIEPGEHAYLIRYRTTRQIGYFKDFDELYYNAVGTGWMFPIDVAEARIRLPSPVPLGKRTLYTGPQGSTASNAEVVAEEPGDITVRTTTPLGAYEGLTVAVAWPKGVVPEPSASTRLGWLLTDDAPYAVALVALLGIFAYYFNAWRRAGRDPRPGTIVPLFSPPDSLTPAAMRYVVDMGSDNRTFAAALIDLGVKGKLRLVEGEKHFFSKAQTMIEKRSEANGLPVPESAMMQELFASGDTILMDQKNHTRFSAAQNVLSAEFKKLYEGKLFVRNWSWSARGIGVLIIAVLCTAAAMVLAAPFRSTVGYYIALWALAAGAVTVMLRVWPVESGTGRVVLRGLGFLAGLVAAGLGIFVFGMAVQLGPIWPLLLLVPGLIVALTAFSWMAAPTKEGRAVLDHIAGFKQYLSITEEERLDRMHPPEMTPALFEKYLPYAVALDVENQWADKFSAVLAAASAAGQAQGFAWYSGHGDPWNHTGSFVDQVGSSLSSTVASASTAPGSSSGSGGGGSSGGGGGGGGGGGW